MKYIILLKDTDVPISRLQICNFDGNIYLIGCNMYGLICSWKLRPRFHLSYATTLKSNIEYSGFAVKEIGGGLIISFTSSLTSNNLILASLNPNKDMENLKGFEEISIPIKNIRKKTTGNYK